MPAMDTAEREEAARLLFSARKYAEAADAYAVLAAEQPRVAKWRTNGAKCLVQMVQHAAALELCRESVALDPRWSRGYEVGAVCLLALQRPAEAQQLLDQGMAAAPSTTMEKLVADARNAARAQASSTQRASSSPEGSSQQPASSFPPQGNLPQQGSPGGANPAGQAPPGSSTQGVSEPPPFGSQADAEAWARVQMASSARAIAKAQVLQAKGRAQEAVQALERLAEGGCTDAMGHLARILTSGEGVPPDPVKGIDWARRCVGATPAPYWRILGIVPPPGVTSCQLLLGDACRDGRGGLARDPGEAARWYRAAADAGDAQGMFQLAEVIKATRGIAGAVEALSWYRRSASLGYAHAMVAVGLAMAEGTGCPRPDLRGALGWFHKAAAQCDPFGIHSLLGYAKRLPTDECMATLEAALGYVEKCKSVPLFVPAYGSLRMASNGTAGPSMASQGNGGEHAPPQGLGGSGPVETLLWALEASCYLEMQRARDMAMSQGDLLRALAALGPSPPSLAEFSQGAPPRKASADMYRVWLMQQLVERRAFTEWERKAAALAETAGKLVLDALASSSGAAALTNTEVIGETLVWLGGLYHLKGMDAEAQSRFVLPAVKLGNLTACYLAGTHLAKRGTSRRELRAARRFLRRAAAGGLPGVQDDLDKLARRLARGDMPPDDDGDDGDGDDAGGESTVVGGGAACSDDRGTKSSSGHCDDHAAATRVGASLSRTPAGTSGGAASSADQRAGASTALSLCWGCEAASSSLQRCGRCRLAQYCSQECQKKHWKGGHREACAKLANQRE
eukprot:jgi/Mesvir1/7385/Mv19186-RA.1